MTDRLPISRRTALQIATAAVAASTLTPRRVEAGHPRVVLPNDRRLGDLKDLNGYFPWQPSASISDWDKRAEYVRRQVLVHVIFLGERVGDNAHIAGHIPDGNRASFAGQGLGTSKANPARAPCHDGSFALQFQVHVVVSKMFRAWRRWRPFLSSTRYHHG